MSSDTVLHEIIVIEREFKAAPEKVYNAWADPEIRERWGTPSPEIKMTHEENDFRVGGRDVGICSAEGGPAYRIETTYQEIVTNHRIIAVERVTSEDTLFAVSLLTVEFSGSDSVTRFKLTIQISALNEDMLKGNRQGWDAALDNLAKLVE